MNKPERIAIFLGHPAHYHMFKNTVRQLEHEGIEVDYVIKRKDIVEELVIRSKHRYYVIRDHERKAKGKIGLATALIAMEIKMIAYILKRRPKLVIGTYAPIFSHLTGVPFIVCCEDDTSVVPRFAKTSYPYATAILAPIYCDGGRWNDKMTKYAGFQKLAYLHPNYFTPNRDIIEPHLRNKDKPFVLMRFAKLQAHHDDGIGGLSSQVAEHLVDILSSKYDIYISSERTLEPKLEPFRLRINPLDIHHWLAYADLYIGDSQSMAVEAAMLGTPAIRYSDFAKRIGVLNELENRYRLTTGIPTNQPEKLYQTVSMMIETENLKEQYQSRRSVMLAEQIDVSQFFTDFIRKQLCSISHQKNTLNS